MQRFLVLLIAFLDWMGVSLVYPMFSAMFFCPECPLVPVETSEAMRGFYLGTLLASMSIAQFFSGPILGALSDQKGRRPLFLISLALGVLGYSFCAFAIQLHSLPFLYFARILVGVSAGSAAIVGASIADLSDSISKAKNFGLYSMACGLGFTSGLFLGGELSQFGFFVPFIFSTLALLLNFLLIFFFFRETNTSQMPLSLLSWSTGLKNIKKAFSRGHLSILFLIVLLFCFGWSFFYEFMPVTWIADYQFNAREIGLFFSFGAAFYALSSGVLIRPILNRFSNNQILLGALFTLGTLLLILLLNPPPKIWVYFYLPLTNFLMALLYPTSTAMVSNSVEKDAQGEILGILQSVQSLAFAISPLAAGTLLGSHPHMPFFVGSLAMLVAGFFALQRLKYAK